MQLSERVRDVCSSANALASVSAEHLCSICSCQRSIALLPERVWHAAPRQHRLGLAQLRAGCVVLHGALQALKVGLRWRNCQAFALQWYALRVFTTGASSRTSA